MRNFTLVKREYNPTDSVYYSVQSMDYDSDYIYILFDHQCFTQFASKCPTDFLPIIETSTDIIDWSAFYYTDEEFKIGYDIRPTFERLAHI